VFLTLPELPAVKLDAAELVVAELMLLLPELVLLLLVVLLLLELVALSPVELVELCLTWPGGVLFTLPELPLPCDFGGGALSPVPWPESPAGSEGVEVGREGEDGMFVVPDGWPAPPEPIDTGTGCGATACTLVNPVCEVPPDRWLPDWWR
jgi:hypothetical protein